MQTIEEKNRKAKRRAFKAGCAVFLFLGVCTFLSVWVQEMMRNEVMTTQGNVQTKAGESWVAFPASAIVWKDGEPRIQYVHREEGLFEREWIVHEKRVPVMEEEDGAVSVPADELPMDSGKVDMIYQAVYPAEEGESVEIIQEETKTLSQREIRGRYAGLLGFLVFSMAVLVIIWKKLCFFQERRWQEGMKGVVLLLLYLVISSWCFERMRIPREILPEEQIFDVVFYLKNLSLAKLR